VVPQHLPGLPGFFRVEPSQQHLLYHLVSLSALAEAAPHRVQAQGQLGQLPPDAAAEDQPRVQVDHHAVRHCQLRLLYQAQQVQLLVHEYLYLLAG
jgi:hypothetical protein